jgi:hypothetical protein
MRFLRTFSRNGNIWKILAKTPPNRLNFAKFCIFAKFSIYAKMDKCIFISALHSSPLYCICLYDFKKVFVFSNILYLDPLITFYHTTYFVVTPLSGLCHSPFWSLSRLISGLCLGFFCLVIKLRFPFFLSSMFPVISVIFGSQIFLTFIAVFILRPYFNM